MSAHPPKGPCEEELRRGVTVADPIGRPIVYRYLLPTDELEAIMTRLHVAYAPLARAGRRFVASYQHVAVTRDRMAKGETLVATDARRALRRAIATAETKTRHMSAAARKAVSCATSLTVATPPNCSRQPIARTRPCRACSHLGVLAFPASRQSVVMSANRLFHTQRLEGAETGGTARGQPAGSERDTQHEEGGGGKDAWVPRAHAVEQRFEEAAAG